MPQCGYLACVMGDDSPTPRRQAAADTEILLHVQNAGDVAASFGAWAATRGSGRWIEGFQLAPSDLAMPEELEYQAILKGGGLSPWVSAGQFCGTRGQNVPLLGFCIRVSGARWPDCRYSGRFVDGSEIGPLPPGTMCCAPSGAPLEALCILLGSGTEAGAARDGTRDLSRAGAKTLLPGAEHYTAYVGPPAQYDAMAATQFRLLTTLGLREHHRLLDFGCGSLRAGRLLIPYLLPGHYYGIEPNTWLVDDAISREIGEDQIRLKQPVFRANADFSADGFGVAFDYILAQSIFSHAGRDVVAQALGGFHRNLAAGGIVLATFVIAEASEYAGHGWVYPQVVAYQAETIARLIREAGMVGMPLPWYHPRQQWYAMADAAEALPPQSKLAHLSGAVLRDPEFAASS